MYNKKAFKVLNEAFVDWLCEIKNNGVSINYVYGEVVSKEGEKYLKSLGMQPCLVMEDDCKYARLFSPSMFSQCENVDKLYNLYSNKSLRKPFEKHILDGHEYLTIKDNVLYYKDINLYELVKKHMMHGPCGEGKSSPCMNKDGKCTKYFPKKWREDNNYSERE